jgi:hypothetical protein
MSYTAEISPKHYSSPNGSHRALAGDSMRTALWITWGYVDPRARDVRWAITREGRFPWQVRGPLPRERPAPRPRFARESPS